MHFSHKAQSAYSMLVPRSLDIFQCGIYSAQFPLPGEHAVPSITACEMALANSHILPGPHLYTWVESRGADFGYFCARVPVLNFQAGPRYPRLANYTKNKSKKLNQHVK